MHYQGLINKYKKYLPVTESTPIVTLNEGNTPLIKADNLAKKIGLENPYIVKKDVFHDKTLKHQFDNKEEKKLYRVKK